MLIKVVLMLSGLLAYRQVEPPGKTYAVVIGVADYQALSYATGDLRYADQDARQVVDFLTSRAGGNVPHSRINLLTNRQATHINIRRALTLFDQAGPADRILFYFSGHGLPNNFVPYDARLGISRTWLSYQLIKKAFHDSRATTKLCIADACLSGGITKQTRQNAVASTINDGNRVAMLLASRSTQYAVEDGRLKGGIFTHFLLKGLRGQADLDGNRIITIRELYQYVSPQIRSRTKGNQTPVFYGRFPDTLPLAYL